MAFQCGPLWFTSSTLWFVTSSALISLLPLTTTLSLCVFLWLHPSPAPPLSADDCFNSPLVYKIRACCNQSLWGLSSLLSGHILLTTGGLISKRDHKWGIGEREAILPQRQEPCSVKNSSERPLDLLIIDQQGRLQVFIIGWEREAWVQYFMHPCWFKTLVPADMTVNPLVKH